MHRATDRTPEADPSVPGFRDDPLSSEYVPVMDADRSAQLECFRRMTPERRWKAAMDLYWSMRRLKQAFVRQQHPEWSEEQVGEEVKKAFMHARD